MNTIRVDQIDVNIVAADQAEYIIDLAHYDFIDHFYEAK